MKCIVTTYCSRVSSATALVKWLSVAMHFYSGDSVTKLLWYCIVYFH